MKKSIVFYLGLLAVLLQASGLWAQSALDHPIPTDPKVISGILDNGLHYYVRNNLEPENRIEFRLAVNAGSILEDDDQQGLAHFIEHMAFNGTLHFSEHDLINFLESSGVDFGADLNAYTSFDETVYMFQIPSDRQGLIDSAFMILRDWAQFQSLTDEEIDKERGVIHEEWRLGLGANDRMMKKSFPIIFNNSRYADRIPIGKMSVIDSCEHDALRRYYHDWYRPDLMAVVVVGDIDPAEAERRIIETFGDLQNPIDARERTEFAIPDNTDPLIAIATDKEATTNTIMLFYKHPRKTSSTIRDYQEDLTTTLYTNMLNARIEEIMQSPGSPFLYATTMYGGFLGRSIDAYMSFAMCKENKINESIITLLQENERVKRYGFTLAELNRQKAQLLSDMEKSVEEKDHTPSKVFVGQYVDNFLTKDPIPGIEMEYQLAQSLLKNITLNSVNNLAANLVSDSNLVIMINGPERDGVIIPTEEEVLNDVALATENNLEPYQEETIASTLISGTITPGTIKEEFYDSNLNIYHLTLNNGANVLVKPTDFKNDEILMTSFANGGTSLSSNTDYMSARYAANIVEQSGIGNFKATDLEKFLSGKNVAVTPYIDELKQGTNGNVVKKDLETLLQLNYLYFTSPRKDSTAFLTFMGQLETQFKFMTANPKAVFYDTLYKLASSNDPRTIVIPTEAQLASISLNSSFHFYQNLFSDANGFTFTFVGNIDMDEFRPLISQYIASLPSTTNKRSWKNVSPKFPKGITEATVYKGSEPQSTVALMMNESFDWSAQRKLQLSMLMKILGIQLRENMREEQGGVYGVRANGDVNKYPEKKLQLLISWGCDPAKADTLVETVFAEMNRLKTEGPSLVNLNKAKETLIRDLETNAKQNRYWLRSIQNNAFNETSVSTIEELQQWIEQTDAQILQNMAKEYFDEKHYLKVILLPEE